MSGVEVIDFAHKVLTPEDVAVRIEELRNLMLVDVDLRRMRCDDAFLLRFLHRTRFSVQKAYEDVKHYYVFVVEEIDWIPLDITDGTKALLNMNMRVMLPAVDKLGKKIFYFRTDTINPSKITIDDLVHLEFIWIESILDDPKVQATGICILIDASGLSWKLMSWLTPAIIKRNIRRMESLTIRDARIHVVQCSSLVKLLVKMVWPALPTKLKERIKVHFDNVQTLYEDISPENIPIQYGGSLEVDFEALNADLLSRDEEMRNKLEHYRLISSR